MVNWDVYAGHSFKVLAFLTNSSALLEFTKPNSAEQNFGKAL